MAEGAFGVGKRIKVGLLKCITVGWCMDTQMISAIYLTKVREAP